MVSNYFLYLIYVCYVMYGWSASILGGVWPKMSVDSGFDLSLLGILVMVNYISSGIASFAVYKIRKKLGTSYSNVLGLSCFFVSMLIFPIANNFAVMIITMLILGFGAGIVDINSNCYVVKAYEPKKVSFMHAFWGLGATLSPMLMSFAMVHLPNYRYGFYITAIIVLIVIIFMLNAKRYWMGKKPTLDKKFTDLHSVTEEEKNASDNIFDLLKIKNSLKLLLCFFFSNGSGCALSAWIASIAVVQRNISATEGAMAASIFFFALMIGRIVFGILANRYGTSKMIFIAGLMATIMIVLYYLPFKSLSIVYIHTALIGFVAGPIIPLLNSNIKELFDHKYLGAFVSFGGVFGLIGIAIISALMTVVSNVIGIANVHIVQIVCFALFTIIYYSILKSVKSN